MAREFWLTGGDERSYWTAEHLKAVGMAVHTYGVPGLADAPLPEAFGQIILPFPSFQGALLKGHSAVPAEEVLCRVRKGTCIYGGLMDPWKKAMEERGGRVFELYSSEPLTTYNAVLTAEGALCLTIEHSPIALYGANCLVIGYGRIGKALAQRLQAFSARVTVAARKKSDLALAEAFGLLSEETGLYRHGLRQFDFIFNTVPFPVLSRGQIKEISPQCLMIELASAPGGICREDCEAQGLSYLSAPGLPGRFSPKTAGALYAQSILDLTFKEEGI